MKSSERPEWTPEQELLIKIKHVFESSRTWGGMDWVYHPVHPFKFQPLVKEIEDILEPTVIEFYRNQK